jgi:hypothetical protein
MQNNYSLQPRLVEIKSIREVQSKYGFQTDKNLSVLINLVFLVILLIAVFFLYDRYNRKQKININKIPNHQKNLM